MSGLADALERAERLRKGKEEKKPVKKERVKADPPLQGDKLDMVLDYMQKLMGEVVSIKSTVGKLGTRVNMDATPVITATIVNKMKENNPIWAACVAEVKDVLEKRRVAIEKAMKPKRRSRAELVKEQLGRKRKHAEKEKGILGSIQEKGETEGRGK